MDLTNSTEILPEFIEGIPTGSEDDGSPPQLDTYYQDKENKYVFVSNLCQKSERNENVRMAGFLAQKTTENVYILPHIQPTHKRAKELRDKYFPVGVKADKNPDFFFRKRFVDGKSMLDIKESDTKTLKRKIQKRLSEAFAQADDVFLEVPAFISKKLIENAIIGELRSSNHEHIVYVKQGDDFLIFP